MMFRQGFVLLIAAASVFSQVEARGDVRLLKHRDSELFQAIRGLVPHHFLASHAKAKARRHSTSSQPKHISAKAHNYHARYHIDQNVQVTGLVSEKKTSDQVDQEFSVGSQGGFEQNVHIPAGRAAHDVKFHYEKGTLDVYVTESVKTNVRQHAVQENQNQNALAANQPLKHAGKRYTTEETVGLAVLATSVVIVASVLIGAVVSLIWSNNRDNALSEAVAPQLDASEESATAPTDVDVDATEEEYEDESFESDSESSSAASETADDKEPVLRDEEMESVEAAV